MSYYHITFVDTPPTTAGKTEIFFSHSVQH